MVAALTAHHAPVLRAPWYHRQAGVALHRYLDDDFIERFTDDLNADRLGGEELTSWQAHDFFAGRRDHVTLRRPLHNTFYLLSCEVSCDVPGFPAYDRSRIRSAGYVIRRVPPGAGSQSWQVLAGRALGWSSTVAGVDPDEARRLRRPSFGSGPKREPPYTGEQVHPLHGASVTDAGGRRRTVLYGLLAIAGGSAFIRRPGGAPADIDMGPVALAAKKELPRPFGTSDTDALDGRALVVDRGRASRAFATFVKLLVERYRVGIDEDEANIELKQELSSWFFDEPKPGQSGDIPPDQRIPSSLSVWDWIALANAPRARNPEENPDEQFRPLLAFLAELPGGYPYHATPLPTGDGTLGSNLHCDADRAQRLGRIAGRRAAALARDFASDVPVARFGHGEDDVYVAQPFIRYGAEACEHVVWGPSSAPFRVASVYSSEAARPTLVPLPSLSDLRGKPTAGFLAPRDLARKLLGLRQEGNGLEFRDGNGPTLDLCWMFGFSIPAITICAFILLMVLLSLLNIIFWWIPFVFLRLPFLCKIPLPVRRSP